MSETKHDGAIESSIDAAGEDYWYGSCTCGWGGKDWPTMKEAAADLDAHYRTSKQVEVKEDPK